MKLKIEDLDKISERMQSVTKLREGSGRARINVHMGTCGIASGARDILSAFLSLIFGMGFFSFGGTYMSFVTGRPFSRCSSTR